MRIKRLGWTLLLLAGCAFVSSCGYVAAGAAGAAADRAIQRHNDKDHDTD